MSYRPVSPPARPASARAGTRRVTRGFGYKKAWLMSKRINEALSAGGEEASLLRTLAASWNEILRPGNGLANQPGSPEDRIRAAACRIIAERGVSSARIA